MKFSLFEEEFKKEQEEPSVVFASETKQSSNLACGQAQIFADETRIGAETETELGLPLLSQHSPRFSLLQKALLVLFIIALGVGSTAYYLRDSAFAATYMNKYLDRQITSGLVGHWTFDGSDITGTSTVLDRSGQGNTGTMTNMATSSRVAGKLGQALRFDGINDVVNSSSAVDLSGTITVSMWVNKASQTQYWRVFHARDAGERSIQVVVDYDFSSFAAIGGGGSGMGGRPVSNNSWHHIVGIFEAGVYVDGYFDGIKMVTPSGGWHPGNTTAGVRIGGGINTTVSYFDGSLDDVRIYNRVLSQKEITRLYKLGEGVKFNVSPNTIVDDGLVGHWTFDGQNMSGNSAYDLSSTHATVTLTNMTNFSRVGGKFGQALQFNGANSYIISAASSSAITSLTKATVSFWVKPRTFSSTSGIFSVMQNDGGGNEAHSGFQITRNVWGETDAVRFSADGSTGDFMSKSGALLQLNAWTHVVVTWDGTLTSATSTQFYFNATDVGSVGGGPSGTYNPSDGYVTIGTNAYASRANSFDGLIDDVRIYNRVLSAKEIERLYQAGGGITVTPEFNCGGAIVTDADGNAYNTVKIGRQCWMKQNMRVGTMVTVATNQTNNSTTEKHCYSDTLANCMTNNDPNQPDGGLYQWDEAMQYVTTPGARGICPSGWHIPTHDEFTTLERAICTSGSCATDFPYDTLTTAFRGTDEGTKLKANGTSLFEANLAGYSYISSSFIRGTFGYFWSSSQSGAEAWYRVVSFEHAQVNRITNVKSLGLSVRCLKD